MFAAICSRFINQYKREILVPISSIDDEVGGLAQVVGLPGLPIDDGDIEQWQEFGSFFGFANTP